MNEENWDDGPTTVYPPEPEQNLPHYNDRKNYHNAPRTFSNSRRNNFQNDGRGRTDNRPNYGNSYRGNDYQHDQRGSRDQNRDYQHDQRGSRDQNRSNFGNYGKNEWGSRGDDRSNFKSNRRFDEQDGSSNRSNFGNSNRGNDDWGSRGQSRSNFNSNQRSDEQNETMTVPSKFVGRIIGRGGFKINELQTSSGARIQVQKGSYDDSEAVVQLYGDQTSIDKAKELITELTTEQDTFGQPSPQTMQLVDNTSEVQNKPSINWQDIYKQCDAKADEEWSKYKPIIKQFYSEHPEITAMTEDEVEQFREASNNIVVDRTFKKEDSKPIPKPVIRFDHAFHNYPEILEEIRKVGFEKPSPIQSQAWPVLLSGEDLIGIAQTGTGKTLAFLLPALIHIDGQGISRDERGGPAVLVMAPTRELALQIDKEVKKYQYKGITSVCLYGGASRKEQVKLVDGGVDIVIATPGRLNDLVNAGHLNVKTVTYVVLDEADRMLDMGFEPQIRKVMYAIRPTRQTVMTSATWPPGVRSLANTYMNDPIQIYVGTLDLAATHTVTQTIQIVEDSEEAKMQVLFDFIQNLRPSDKVIVFCGKKSRADDLASELALSGIGCQTMHGDRDQIDREQALLDIADGTVQILIATDLASRGLDIEDITHVLNYDFPRNIEEYVHRVGRTGRAGRSGESISYFTRADWGQAKDLIKILQEAQQFVPEEIYKMAERFEARKQDDGDGRRRFGGGGHRFKKW